MVSLIGSNVTLTPPPRSDPRLSLRFGATKDRYWVLGRLVGFQAACSISRHTRPETRPRRPLRCGYCARPSGGPAGLQAAIDPKHGIGTNSRALHIAGQCASSLSVIGNPLRVDRSLHLPTPWLRQVWYDDDSGPNSRGMLRCVYRRDERHVFKGIVSIGGPLLVAPLFADRRAFTPAFNHGLRPDSANTAMK